ncbi:Alpha-ribazole phosphatase [Crenothrix polyspora]|uniref:Alpha-ribazole phosphatase n=1 Tax=Crenothrix polyspora TaxID=360316 RepID=A0A1R4HHD0_9GAMM|nr:alpha-ribazole phosphatase [Crenothrix polyspora]SJM95625.1 Alpha-ribazole phosphatase [Crenothrix polyspora]
MDIYLIRHTQTDTAKGLCYGQSDVALAKGFPEHWQQLQQKLPLLTDDCLVFSSPLQRCLQLAEQLSNSVTSDERLLEVNFGDWEGRRFDDIDADTLQHWTTHFVHIPPPNGECFSALCLRVGDFWQELLTYNTKQALIITHAGVIRALLTHILQLQPANAFHFQVDAGSIHKLQYLNNYTYISYINR